jgi:hypothetical protein
MGPGWFEQPTSRLSGVRSNQLSYEPNSIADFQSPITSIAYRNSAVVNWKSAVDCYNYKLKKEQQKNRCSTASGFYGLTVMPCGSLKQKLATHQDFFQNPNPEPFRRPQNSTADTFV